VACALALFATPASAATGSISGTVTGPAAQPLANVQVAVSAGGSAWSERSAADGSYEVTGLPDGSYQVAFAADGYLRQYYNGASSPRRARQVAVAGGAAVTGIDAKMQAAGTISGTVTDASGTPLAGIWVSAYAAGRALPGVQTKSDGAYSIGELPEGDYTVRFAAAAPVAGFDRGGGNYLPQYYDGRSKEGDADTVFVEAGADTGGIDARMAPGGQISGVLTDDSGAAVDGMHVTAYDAAGEEAGSWYTESDGRYLIDQLPSGTYTLGFASFPPGGGPNEIDRFRDGRATLAGASGFTVTAGSTTEVDETVIRGGEVSGTVTDAHGTPVERVQARLLTGSGEAVAEAQTGPGGRYEIEGVRSGSYVMEFKPIPGAPPAFSGSGNFLTTYFDGAETLASADPVEVTAGSATTGIDAAMPAGGRLSGTVKAAVGGESLAGVTVTAYDASGDAAGSALTQSDGTYTVAGLPPGSYRERFSVRAGGPFSPSPGNFAPQYDGGAATLATAEPTAVTAGGPPGEVDAQLEPGATISGVLTDGEGDPVPEESVAVYDEAGEPAGGATTESDGSYTISDLAGGVYRVGFDDSLTSAERPEFAPRFYDGTTSLAAASKVTVAAGGSIGGIDAQLVAGGEISGTVSDERGDPLLGVDFVTAYDGAGRFASWGEVQGDGRYTIRGLGSGTYRVGFENPTDDGYEPAFFGGDSLTGATGVEVSTGAVKPGIDFTVRRASGWLSGVVMDGTLPAPAGVVTAYDDSGSPAGSASTNGTGAYAIEGLAPGFYRLAYLASGSSASHFFAGAETLAGTPPVLAVSGASAEGLDMQLASSAPPGASPPPAGSSGIAGTRVESHSRPLTQAQKRARAIAAGRELAPGRRARCIAAAKRRFPTQGECMRTWRSWQRRHPHAATRPRRLERSELKRHGCRV